MFGEGAPPPLGGRGTPEEQAHAIVSRIFNFLPEGGPPSCQNPAPTNQAQHIQGARGKGRRGGRGRGREGGVRGKTGERSHIPPPPPQRRREQSQERHKARENGAETEAEKDKAEEEKEGDREGETPRGAPVEVNCVGGTCPPQRKTRTFWDSPHNVCNCCCRESMETS